MTSREINRMPLHKQFTMVAHLYKMEILELCHLCGRAFAEVALAASGIIFALASYHAHRQHVRHR